MRGRLGAYPAAETWVTRACLVSRIIDSLKIHDLIADEKRVMTRRPLKSVELRAEEKVALQGLARLRTTAQALALRAPPHRWASVTPFLEDGRVAIDNNTAERAIRPIAVGRKNFYSPAPTPAGRHSPMTIIETAKLNNLNPEAYIADILGRINDHKINALNDLLPWLWRPAENHTSCRRGLTRPVTGQMAGSLRGAAA